MEPEANIDVDLLGYRIECMPSSGQSEHRFRVICPLTAEVLAQFADPHSAERYILQRELRASHARIRHPAY